jgi:hypothetical protein
MTIKTEIEWRCNSITHRMEEGAFVMSRANDDLQGSFFGLFTT